MLDDPQESLQHAGLQTGDQVTALVPQANLIGTRRRSSAGGGAFALWFSGCDGAITWGHPDFGGDSWSVQSQLKGVQQLQATQGAFAAILADGSAVSWGSEVYGGDSSAVQSQLKGVQQLQATFQCICCHFGRWVCGFLGIPIRRW